MKNKIKIDIVSDVVCPWCIIGYKRLEKAIKELGFEDKIEIEWHPFELNPNMPVEGENVIEHVSNKYGMNKEQALASQKSMTNNGEELGFKFNYFDEMKIVNTRDAHILLDFAKEFGKQTKLKMRLMEAFFSEQKDISNRDILLKEFQSIGLDIDKAREILEDKKNREEIKIKESSWQKKGISAVPTMIFNNDSMMNGAYPVETYKQVLSELIENSNE